MPTDFDRLKSQLMTAGIQQKQNALFQVINQLIGATKELQSLISVEVASSADALADLGYLTDDNESVNLPNSRQLIAGTNVAFDDTVANQRTINVSAGISSIWEPLTDGNISETELIYALGDVIMCNVP